MSIKRVRRAVSDENYLYSNHALEEMDMDSLVEEDVRNVLLHGQVMAELSADPRGIRFVVQGHELYGSQMIEVVCRFLPSGWLRIITVYALEE